MGCKSPVGVPTWTRHESKDNHEPKARARPRGLVRRKPECKRCEATNRNRIQGRGRRGELAHDSKAHRYGAYGKCGACAPTVRVLTWGDLRRVRCALRVSLPASDQPGLTRSRRRGELPAASDEQAATTITATARRAATRDVRAQKSADAVVGGQVSGRRRVEQRDTRSRRMPTSNASTKPDRARCARRPARTEP
jgi:hypothetical protein